MGYVIYAARFHSYDLGMNETVRLEHRIIGNTLSIPKVSKSMKNIYNYLNN
jgi:hypothetical protein